MLLLTVLAMAQASAPVSTHAKPKAAEVDQRQRVICIDSATTGSRIPGRRVCRTADQWEQDRLLAKDGTEQSQRTNTIHGN